MRTDVLPIRIASRQAQRMALAPTPDGSFTSPEAPPEVSAPAHPPSWRLGWLTPGRCRIILAALLAYGFVSHLHYIRSGCPIDLSGDEAQYWEWSRNLDLSYYSKGPLVAYIIRASCAAFGDVAWAVRLPALVLGVATSILTYLLTRKLFGSDRLALGVVLLYHVVPMFIAGSVLMTIDPPYFFCWALATYLLAHAVFDDRKWVWPVIGLVTGAGFLAKYAALLWLPIALVAVGFDRKARPQLKTGWPWLGGVVALSFMTPVIVWNARHNWVTVHHVATQTGADGEEKAGPLNIFSFVGGQIVAIGPSVFLFMVAGVLYAFWSGRRWALGPLVLRAPSDTAAGETDRARRAMRLLVIIGSSFFAIVAVDSLRAKVQVNWPAPAYFTLMILAGYFLSTRLRERPLWKPWRPWFWGAVVVGLLTMPLIHNFEIVYPAITRYNAWRVEAAKRKGVTDPAKLAKVGLPSMRDADPMAKLKGWVELGQYVNQQLALLGPGAIVMGEDYQYAAEMGFYVPGQPKAYCAGSFFVTRPKRASQFDMWKDRSLDPEENPQIVGKDAVYVGWPRPDLWRAFDAVEELPLYDVKRGGLLVRQFRVFRCYNFHGMKRNVKSF